jgi:CRISPR/Cas system CSM-associated protein Csm3 (group 7 of RAMP superfamily)
MYSLKIILLSDTTFGRGDGVAGLVDQEVEHDRYGFPYLRGRTLKGLLSEECDNFIALYIDRLEDAKRKQWIKVRHDLFGEAGSITENMAKMHVGDACLPPDLRQAIVRQQEQDENKNKFPTRDDVLSSLTAIRRQTAINSESGVAVDHSLRSSRVIIRGLEFTANFLFDSEPTEEMKALLYVGSLALRRIGSGRNRGRGHVRCNLLYNNVEIDAETGKKYLQNFN